MSTDAELLRRYVEDCDEDAFGELVRQNLDLVYAAALRRSGGWADLAEDIAQKVFCDLARKAPGLLRHTALNGWLHQSTRFAAIDAVRSEVRRQKLTQTLTAMPDVDSRSEPPVDWEGLRPVIDAALDDLSERDREMILLRFFKGLTFAELASRLTVPESTARLRAERALDKLRVRLGKRGVTSTAAALGLLLANQPLAAAPPGLAATVTAAGLAAAPAAGGAGVVAAILMNKLNVSIISAVVAAGSTALIYTSAAPGVTSSELESLRRENARLTLAAAPDASREAITSVGNEYEAQAAAIAKAMAERRTKDAPTTSSTAVADAKGIVSPRGHRNHGTATPLDAELTFAWAGDLADPVEIAKVITFDPEVRKIAEGVLASMPDAVRAEYPTPEAFYGMLLAASSLEAPPPGEELISRLTAIELVPGRVALRQPGSTRNFHEFQQTQDGWKHVIPEAGVKGLPSILNSETLAKLGGGS